MLGRMLGLFLCLVGLLLPHRLRIWFSELLGWCTQGIYYAYYGLLNYLVKELRKGEAKRD